MLKLEKYEGYTLSMPKLQKDRGVEAADCSFYGMLNTMLKYQ